MKQMTFTKAMLESGLRLPSESAGAFAIQLKNLTEADRAWFVERFAIEQNIEIVSVLQK